PLPLERHASGWRPPGCLRYGDGRAVAGRGDGERTGGARRVVVGAPGRGATRRRLRHGSPERAGALGEAVDGGGGGGGGRGPGLAPVGGVECHRAGRGPG